MNIRETFIDGLVLAETLPFEDHRGAFSRFFCKRELSEPLRGRDIVQINCSMTVRAGAIRGLHYQRPPFAEMKFVRCLRGKVWDVAVDLRAGSPTFLQHLSQELTPENGLMMVIPEGFAHGFQALEEKSELLYLHTESYAPDSQSGLRWNDPRLEIAWPLPVSEISSRDSTFPMMSADFSGVVL